MRIHWILQYRWALAVGVVAAASFAAIAGTAEIALATDNPAAMLSPGLVIPTMNPVHGRQLFASKGCVVCHSINGVGGTDAPKLDADTMKLPMNPFDFAARMWRGAPAMIMMQQDELGHQIEFTGQELADIIAFAHDAPEQKKFSEEDIPEKIRDLMESDEEHEGGMDEKMEKGMEKPMK